ncbi:MAG: chromate resistance protein ChrB domain-containing protein, partial [Brachymonas sp.]
VGTAAAPVLLDVRRDAAFAASTQILAGAQRCAPQDIARWAALHEAVRDQTVVVYCVYGHNVSKDACSQLRALGFNAHVLAGGFQGGEDGVDAASDIGTWRAASLPTWRKRNDLGLSGAGGSRWVTRVRPKIDRIACPWLVRRWIDAQAKFDYVPDAQVLSHAQQVGGLAFDVVGAPITHEDVLCSFDALLQVVDLHTPALNLLARIVRGADTDLLQLESPCAGLLAVTQGMSRLHVHDDAAMLEAMMPIYDALYAWCVDQAQGRVEHHAWAAPAPLNTAALRRQAESARRSIRA